VGTRWGAEQVLALAPDAGSAAAAGRLAIPAPWTGVGHTEHPAAVWGECRGSGQHPYRTVVDLAGPAFHCSCASRKFPCKHALALLLLWSGSGVPEAAAPIDWAMAWLSSRVERAARATAEPSGIAGPGPSGGPTGGLAHPVAARRRAEQREQRMAAGLSELDQWLRDQVRTGLAGTERAGYQLFDGLAARMVDAQIPGVASTARRLAGVAVSGEGWPGRLLEEYALLRLLTLAAGTPDAGAQGAPVAVPDAGKAAGRHAARGQLGVPVGKDEVLAGPAIRDCWSVLGLRDTAEDRLTARRVWLRGERSGRFGQVLSFAMPGQALDATLVPGTSLEADLHFYPSAAPLRALVGTRHAEPAPAPASPVPGVTLGEALDAWAAALAADPWLRAWPVVLAAAVPVLDGSGWWLAAGDRALPLRQPGDSGWTLLAVSGGHPIGLLAEVVPGGLRAISALPGGSHPTGCSTELVTL
jgi:hypothetical protein